MARIVMKFGGTSVADLPRIGAVAERVKREVDAGHEVAVVLSAMAGATNQLVAWVREYETRDDEYGLARHRAIFDAYAGRKREHVRPVGPDEV